MKKVLITGSSGYIGSHLCNFLKDDYDIYGLDIDDPQVNVSNFFKLDINSNFVFSEEIYFDTVIHLAALTSVPESQKYPIKYYNTNLNGTINLLNKIKYKNFIFASTGTAQDCLSAYGVSKRAAEDTVRYFAKQNNTDYTIFRFYNVIGNTVVLPKNSNSLLYNLNKARQTGIFTVYGTDYPNTVDGTCVRDVVHVEEICYALKLAIEDPANNTECLGHGVGYTVLELAKMFMEINNCHFEIVKGPRRDGDIESYVLSDVSRYMKNLYKIHDLLRINVDTNDCL